ncbi:MAG: hypothetical protein PHC51_05595 [bacterium]|nr:hypothetical protein [bacterium]
MVEHIKVHRLDFPGSAPSPLALNSIQKQVFEILSTTKSQKYSLATWYLGAIYAAKNIYNPDRFSQAAQSLRELLEKLPRVFVESEIQESKPDFKGMRVNLYSRLCSDKNRYEGEWNGKTIDTGLDKTIRGVDKYFELNQIPTRKKQIHSMISKIDPMHDTLDQGIRFEKSERFHSVWDFFEGLAHHNTHPDEETFWQQLSLTERIVIDLLAPITAQDQDAIRAILEKPQPEQGDVENMLELIKRRGANYAYFFKTVDNPVWINPLSKNGFFKNPPGVEAAGDGRIITSLWWPIFYLQRVSEQNPKQVVDIILGLEQTDNPRILREIFSIAGDLKDTALSLRLKPLIMQFLKSPYRWGEEELIVKILNKWGEYKEGGVKAALKIAKYVLSFQADPRSDEKVSRRQENANAGDTSLEPAPRFKKWEYQQILTKGVRPLSDKEPLKVANILVKTTSAMVGLKFHPDYLEQGLGKDSSEIWCPRLDSSHKDHPNTKESLVQTLFYACRQVYEKSPAAVEALDRALRNQRWQIFSRIRQHLYALYPSEQTLPWIREFILNHPDYSKWEHHYEFQLMIRRACEHFGKQLLGDAELEQILGQILRGPSEDNFREYLGERFSPAAFQERQRYFHLKQLRPFACLLSGENLDYYENLTEQDANDVLDDDSYMPYRPAVSGWVSYQSPRSYEELDRLSDAKLLEYLNNWNNQHHSPDDWLVEISFSALSEVLQSLFKTKIAADNSRLIFWMANRDQILRPIYVRAIVEAFKGLIQEKVFDCLPQSMDFCKWILTHPDKERIDGQPLPQEESAEYPDWGNCRRAVVDFIIECLKKETAIPLTARAGLAGLLDSVCTQFDWRLDRDHPVLLNREDQFTEAINNTRSRALDALIKFGFWIRKQEPDDLLSEVTGILSKRLSKDSQSPLTRPEYAILGVHFTNLCTLNQNWANDHKETLFPRTNSLAWRDAFGCFILHNRPLKIVFEILHAEYEYAVDHLNILSEAKEAGEDLVEQLGKHLLSYYLWDVYSLTGNRSLLERFYKKNISQHEILSGLFAHLGDSLVNSGKHIDEKLSERVVAYFNWRAENKVPEELSKFSHWLEAECMPAKWRLESFSKALDLAGHDELDYYQTISGLHKLLPENLALVSECLAKLTATMNGDTYIHLPIEETRNIMSAGLQSTNDSIAGHAKRAQEYLLKLCRFEFLKLPDSPNG